MEGNVFIFNQRSEDVVPVFYPLAATRHKTSSLPPCEERLLPLLHLIQYPVEPRPRRIAPSSLRPHKRGEFITVMMNVLSSQPQNLKLIVRGRRSPPCRVQCPVDPGRRRQHARPFIAVVGRAVSGSSGESSSSGGEDDDDDDKADKKQEQGSSSGLSREDLERLVGPDDAKFNGLDLANLIRKKYGRSYDVTLIKKEFMGRNLLAMNVMWKYREQRSFPLSEEEYLLRLDDVANTLKCWGAVSHVRNTLEKLKERPRIGKAVSIFIDMDETGGRSNEWIYK